MLEEKNLEDPWIVITGALGFIGSVVVGQLNEMGYDKTLILVDDFKESSKWKNLLGLKYLELISRFDFFDWLNENVDQIDAIIHLGANSSTVGINGDDYYDFNYRYTIELARLAIENDIRFIYASSAATYGNGDKGFSDTIKLDDLRPLNLYGMSKQMVDLWMERNGLWDQVVGLKYFNVYGPNEYHKGRMASMVYHMFHQIESQGKVKLFCSNTTQYKDGDQERDFIYVKDAAKITIDFLFNDLCGIYNVGTGQARSFNDMARALFKALDREPVIEYIPMPLDLYKTYQNYTCADMTKLESEIKIPRTSLEEGVFDYVTNYLKEDKVISFTANK